ncbi:COP9 signalosome complex subunit 6-like [Styela clava]|uniref:COP9 signalosome complex subunit 6-like n=1 Tax=Styela clava TaxID=7725 RepID=UPI001939477F|nr:COP9 signalosome complex subunit 6-like [Styela clava]
MDVEESSSVATSSKKSVMAATGTSASVAVQLHPLVIMNISEHWTRIRAQEGQAIQVLGALIGKQTGRKVEVMNSFELLYTQNSNTGEIVIDSDYYYTKEEQFKQVFKDLDFLGWYTTGGSPTEADLKIHKQMCGITECPIIVKLNPQALSSDLPISAFESVIDLGDGEAQMRLVELPYTLATEEAERIGVDHVARVSNVESGSLNSSAADHLQSQHNSISMLHTRICFLQRYIQAVKEGKLPHNHEITREAYALCHRLPVLDCDMLSKDLYDQYNDVTLMTYLGVISKGCHTMNQFISKFNVMCDRQGVGRRIRGLFP